MSWNLVYPYLTLLSLEKFRFKFHFCLHESKELLYDNRRRYWLLFSIVVESKSWMLNLFTRLELEASFCPIERTDINIKYIRNPWWIWIINRICFNMKCYKRCYWNVKCYVVSYFSSMFPNASLENSKMEISPVGKCIF